MTKLIVLDENIGSMTEFKQIIGRGTRLREKEGKTHFVVMDFRGVSRLFYDPDWDGPIEIDPNFHTPEKKDDNDGDIVIIDPPEPTDDPKLPKPYVDVNGCKVRIINKVVSVYDADGKLLRHENIIDYTKTNILGEYADLDHFVRSWNEEEKKKTISELFKEHGIDIQALKESQGMGDIDDFDFIIHIAFDKKPLTRKERANDVKKRDFISKYNGLAREVLEALLEMYSNEGIYQIEDTQVLKLDPFIRMGKPAAIVKLFGGKDGYMQAVRELEEEIYKEIS